MALVIQAPRGTNKSWLQQVYTGNTMRMSRSSIPFPRKSGFNSEQDLIFNLGHVIGAGNNFDITPHILNIGAYTKNLGNTYIDYIMLNIHAYITLLSLPTYNESSLTHELIYSKALSKLITINLYKKHLGEEYSLPTVLSRKFINIDMSLTDYLNGKKDIIHMGIFDDKTK